MAALGALAVCGGVVLTYGLIWWLARTTPVGGAIGATGGIDVITRNVLWTCALVPTVLFVWSHVVFARQLNRGRTSLNE